MHKILTLKNKGSRGVAVDPTRTHQRPSWGYLALHPAYSLYVKYDSEIKSTGKVKDPTDQWMANDVLKVNARGEKSHCEQNEGHSIGHPKHINKYARKTHSTLYTGTQTSHHTRKM